MATEKCGDWHECRDAAADLHRAIGLLEQQIELLDVQAARDQEWYALLTEKLLPQLGSPEFLVVAVTGGTNTGKSSVFNQLAGTRASSASPLAAGTRHPVCLVPSEFSEQARLQQIFPEQRLQHWQNADDALLPDEQNLLFWRECAELPSHLLLLDTPDIDSDARVNWERADKIRRT
ncbi:MAG: GTPase, partial [Planctomycetaceae bacterium]